MNFIDLGFKDYKETWEFQKEIHRKRVKGEIADTLIFVEHPPVFTIGRGGDKKNLLVSKSVLKKKQIPLYEIERGGDITFHGPGQLVGYPIFYIKENLGGVKPFIEKIQDAVITALSKLKIEGRKIEGYTGVWVGKKKICAIGVAIQRWVSFHGFALNVNTDLNYFNYIVPCGLKDKGITSIREVLQKEVDFKEVKKILRKSFSLDKDI